MTMSSKEQLLAQINRQVVNCQQCRLCKGRTQAVPGAGPSDAQIAFVGEAPGFNEDQQGEPFVGKAGALLVKLLREINLTREQVWIGNVIKCRPPDNRDPLVDEIRACTPYLQAQLRTIDPRIIVPLGRFGMNHFLSEAKISRDHGVPKMLVNRIIYPVYHPAAALRSARVGVVLREDFVRIPKILQMDPKEIESAKISKGAVEDDQMGLL